MLQALRNKLHGWPTIIILGICVFAVAFFGIESYFMSQTDTYVAKVGKHEISQQAFQDRVNQLRREDSQRLGDQFDPSVYDTPAMKQRILDAMIDEQLLLQANEALGLKVSDTAVRESIAAIPAFQSDGHFDADAYRAALAGAGQTPAAFDADMRAALAMRLVPDALTASTLVTDDQLQRYLDLELQRRDLRYAVLPKPATVDATVSDAEIAAYYQAHLADFTTPERVAVKYLEVNGAELKVDAAPSDEALRKRYAQEQQRFLQPEQRLASHILISVPKNATAEQQKAALAKAEEIAKQANAANFAELAQKYSDDLGSKRQGGDLGWLEKGVANAAFDAALFAMHKGEISKPVLSDEGYHIIWLRDVRQGQVKPFEEVRAQLMQEETVGARERKYAELAGKLADETYRNPASLEPAAQSLGLPIKDSGWFGRDGGSGIAANPKVVQAAFSEDVLVRGNNSGLIEIAPNHAVVLHLDRHENAHPRPLDEVRDTVRQKILDERRRQAAKNQAEALLARLRKGEDFATVAASAGAQIRDAREVLRMQPDVPAAIREAAFHLPHPAPGTAQWQAVAMPDGSYALLALDKVQGADPAKVDARERQMLREGMRRAYGEATTRDYLKALRQRIPVKIAAERL
ncbi:MAG: SurA N-terminal domain-containing protein [Fulvimonas sp.]|nr:SurA N-terminal domain-containing protein [Fulvimonas sp.]